MNPVLEERLFRHVDFELYDKKGFIDYKSLRETLDVKVKDLAYASGITPRSLEKNPHSKKIQYALRKIAYIYNMLEEMTGSKKDALVWLKAPNPDYNGISPLEIILEGKVGEIIDYLDDIKKGALT